MTQFTLDHPPPVHLAARIADAIEAEAKRRGELPPLWIDRAISEGVKQACAEHDAK